MSDAPRIRVDPIRGWSTLVAPRRAERPFDDVVDPRAPEAPEAAEDEADCPFCPGGEGEIGEILETSPPVREGDPWGSRAVRNRYPFTGAWGGSDAGVAGLQEVIVDSPSHTADPELQEPHVRRALLSMWRSRVAAARRRAPEAEIHLFRNHGRAAGSSRRHPHAQLVQMRAPTPGRTEMLARLAAADGCPLCAAGAEEGAEYQVLDRAGWRVMALSAPLDPGHLRIVPVRHLASFADLDDAEVAALADLLGPLTAATLRATGAGAYSLIVHETDRRAGRGSHLHLEFRPRVSRTAGFEQSSGLGVCSADPASTASRIRTSLAAVSP